ncbi:hypothetical protein B0H14DRAFT_3761968 [Mycena olivaceomarginata]|nr:hypothetical protein B0H14DRAFT_3761968 [Mycena olivaceomarginata]
MDGAGIQSFSRGIESLTTDRGFPFWLSPKTPSLFRRCGDWFTAHEVGPDVEHPGFRSKFPGDFSRAPPSVHRVEMAEYQFQNKVDAPESFTSDNGDKRGNFITKYSACLRLSNLSSLKQTRALLIRLLPFFGRSHQCSCAITPSFKTRSTQCVLESGHRIALEISARFTPSPPSSSMSKKHDAIPLVVALAPLLGFPLSSALACCSSHQLLARSKAGISHSHA